MFWFTSAYLYCYLKILATLFSFFPQTNYFLIWVTSWLSYWCIILGFIMTREIGS